MNDPKIVELLTDVAGCAMAICVRLGVPYGHSFATNNSNFRMELGDQPLVSDSADELIEMCCRQMDKLIAAEYRDGQPGPAISFPLTEPALPMLLKYFDNASTFESANRILALKDTFRRGVAAMRKDRGL